jgi:(p)ppGpp synthase/HD superfamily hydrolase
MIERAKLFASTAHTGAGQVGYFDRHVMRVYQIGLDYLANNSDSVAMATKHSNAFIDHEMKQNLVKLLHPDLLVVALLHDVLEDCASAGITKEIIENNFGKIVADDVWRLTDEPGKNRKERKLKTYHKIRGSQNATIVKLWDRIANVESCIDKNEEKNRDYLNMYMKEYYTFKAALWNGENDPNNPLWSVLDKLHGFKI